MGEKIFDFAESGMNVCVILKRIQFFKIVLIELQAAGNMILTEKINSFPMNLNFGWCCDPLDPKRVTIEYFILNFNFRDV